MIRGRGKEGAKGQTKMIFIRVWTGEAAAGRGEGVWGRGKAERGVRAEREAKASRV